jgi:uncharacterized protein (TIGR02284 family)
MDTPIASNDLASRLNALLIEVEDGGKGFATAAQECDALELKSLLQECADDCVRALHELQGSARTVNGSDIQHASVGAAVRQGWAKLKSVAISDPVLALLDEAEHGQQRIEDAFAAVLEAEPPPAIREVVRKQSRRIGGNRARLEQIRRHHADS